MVAKIDNTQAINSALNRLHAGGELPPIDARVKQADMPKYLTERRTAYYALLNALKTDNAAAAKKARQAMVDINTKYTTPPKPKTPAVDRFEPLPGPTASGVFPDTKTGEWCVNVTTNDGSRQFRYERYADAAAFSQHVKKEKPTAMSRADQVSFLYRSNPEKTVYVGQEAWIYDFPTWRQADAFERELDNVRRNNTLTLDGVTAIANKYM